MFQLEFERSLRMYMWEPLNIANVVLVQHCFGIILALLSGACMGSLEDVLEQYYLVCSC